ncbi:angiogenic factor with G patch and FHA domains 1 isoform X1 [Pangasianodon hypophthalmus]|uniref:angiogenic factor with G patch and FHA domains 1 isoform X1 n=2 Tax=Pangasianodon hypophthalmus TaxID=310915 RepID=UPI002307C8DA|nr:angiogenic factor with G patch and FHA domains 1 isoform X1 [Pangasianodon hypophthalmus]
MAKFQRVWSMERETDVALQMEEKSVSLEDKCKSEPAVFQEDEIPDPLMTETSRFEEPSLRKDDGSKAEPAVPQDICLGSEVAGQKMEGCGSEVSDLQMEMRSLQQELGKCQIELKRVQKQLDQSLRLQRSTESFNHDLRQQVEELSAELHERKKKEKSRVEAETQTEDYTQVETDYSYYYSGYYQAAAEPALNTATEIQETSDPVTTETATASLPQSDDVTSMADTEVVVSSSSSIAAMLRATAEEAVSQTGFVFDESSGMYYDHSTGFYYDSSSQLYYDANTGIYYCYDHNSGKYQFHSRIELSTVQLGQTANDQENVNKWKSKRTSERPEHPESQNHSGVKERPKAVKDQEEHSMGKKGETVTRRKGQCSRSKKRLSRSRSRTRLSRSRSRTRLSRSRSRTRLSRSRSRTRLSRSRSRTRLSRSLSRTRLSRSRSRTRLSRSRSRTRLSRSRSRLHRQNRTRSEDRKKKKKKKKKSHSHRDWSSHTTNMDSESEPEEGEILPSRATKYPSSSSSSASPSPPPDTSPVSYSPERDTQPVEEGWPPCVRVIVVRSPVLEPGTLFILTADNIATIGREKDMDHAIRIPEMGVSKCHAEVYFDQDQQCYMLVDRGSQNGTVLNGNRILQPKVRCDPCPLTHGDEVKLGETVLSFHIHMGSDTCDACEPGQVRAHLSYRRPEENMGVVLSKEDKEVQRQRQLKQIKLKYGLKNSAYEGGSALSNKYKDRAENRRQTVGSEGTFYRDDAPASVHVEISDRNKGRQMLERMGWKSGEGLGKDGGGITEPVEVQVRVPQSGLGCGAIFQVDEVPAGRSRRQQNWEHARERFQHADLSNDKPDAGDVLLSDP